MIDLHWLVNIANNEEFKCFQLEDWLFFHYLAKKNKIKCLQLRLFSFNDNLFENDIKKAPGPIKPNKNLGFLCLWSGKSYDNW